MAKEWVAAAEKGASPLPGAPWFSLDLYRDIPNWAPLDWYRAIHWRLTVATSPETYKNHWKYLSRSSIASFAMPQYLHGKSEPVRTLGAEGPISGMGEYDFDEFRIEKLKSWLQDSFDNRLLSVDLGASDVDLKAAFAHWLKSQRWEKMPVRNVTEDDLQNWTTSKVIPYIDIKLYESVIEKRFRPVDIQTALFIDDSIDKAGREPKKIFEQSTQMYARRLMSDRYVKRIAFRFGRSAFGQP